MTPASYHQLDPPDNVPGNAQLFEQVTKALLEKRLKNLEMDRQYLPLPREGSSIPELLASGG
jgi:hypothetical protein